MAQFRRRHSCGGKPNIRVTTGSQRSGHVETIKERIVSIERPDFCSCSRRLDHDSGIGRPYTESSAPAYREDRSSCFLPGVPADVLESDLGLHWNPFPERRTLCRSLLWHGVQPRLGDACPLRRAGDAQGALVKGRKGVLVVAGYENP